MMFPQWAQGAFQIDANATPEQIARKRALIEQMMPRYGSARYVGEGIGHLATGLAAGLKNRQLDKFEAGKRGEASDAFKGMLGTPNTPQGPLSVLGLNPEWGGGPALAEGGPEAEQRPYSITPNAAPGAAALAREDVVRGLVERGLPQHVAEGFAMNAEDESGLNPSINEASPLVPGSRGGFGLMQWTGPRRKQLEAFAQQTGRDVADPNVQMDFLVSELQGSERGAAQAIMAAATPGEAGAAIVNKFLRPAEEHRARRAAAYTGGQGGGQAQPFQMPAYSGPPIADLQAAVGNPWLSESERAMAQTMLDQAMQQGDPAYQMKMQQGALGLQKSQMEIAQMGQPQQAKPLEINGQLVDPQTGQVLGDYRDEAGGEPSFRPATPEEAGSYGAPAGQFGPDGRFYPINPPSGMTVETGPDGQVRIVQGVGAGGGGKPLTESEGRNTGFLLRAQKSEEILSDLEAAGTSLKDRTAAAIPILGNYAVSDDYQQFEQAKRDFVNAILRRESGAVISEGEFINADKQYFPQPGDSPATIAQKRDNRASAIAGLNIGSGKGANMLPTTATPAPSVSDDDLLKKYGG